jgi:flagellar FliL protein
MVIDNMPNEAMVPAPDTPGRWRRRTPLLAGAAAALLLVAAGAGYMLLGRGGGDTTAATASDAATVYVDAPAMLVNLHSADGQARFLKLRFIIVAANAAKGEEIKARLPAILDALQPFLRELRPEDLNGSAAVFRVKEEMMVRTTSLFGPGAVRDILIQDLVQQ